MTEKKTGKAINVNEVLDSMGRRLQERFRNQKGPEYAVDDLGTDLTKEEIAEIHRKLRELSAK